MDHHISTIIIMVRFLRSGETLRTRMKHIEERVSLVLKRKGSIYVNERRYESLNTER